ncbi:hypothetical protein TcYC6_0064330 [Trypanosoma cruzi]|nr:hypothetical protein TcYC6_0064330 [Trypanosoma cruzi]
MIYDVLELLMNYMQYLHLMVLIAPSMFPTLYSSLFWLVDIVMNAVFSNGGDHNMSNKTKPSQEAGGMSAQEGVLGLQLPSWVPVDVRLLFALTNIFAPLVLVFLSTLLLGPPHFAAFVYLLCASFFWMIAGILLLLLLLGKLRDTDALWQNGQTILAITHALSVHEAVVMTAVSASAVVLLLVIGVVLCIVLGARERARVLERLRQLECAPCTEEERVARRLLQFDSTGLENEEEMEKEARVRRARAEMAYQRLFWSRYKETHSLSLLWTFIKLIMCILCVASAFVFALAPKMDFLRAIQIRHVCYPLAALLFLLGLLFVASFLLGLTRKGRQRLFKIKLWLHHMFLYVVLLAVSFMYSPILRNAISLFPCQTVACTVFDGSSYSDEDTSSIGSYAACMQRTTTHVSCLSSDPNVPCNGIDGFLMASAVLATSAYAVFFLLLYGLVARQALRALQRYPLADSVTASSTPFACKEEQRTGIGRRFDGDVTDTSPTMPMDSLFATNASALTASRVKKTSKKIDVLYRERVSSSRNEAQFLYAPYAYAFRYFKLVVLAQKTLMVIISTLMRQGSGVASPWMGFAACVLIHAGFAVVLIVCRPYAEPLEIVVSLALQVMLSVVAAMGLTSALASTAIPVPLWSFVTSCLFLVPFAAVIAGEILTFRQHSQRKAWREKDAKQSSCRSNRHFWRRWGNWLLGYFRKARPVPSYERCGGDRLGNEVFIPALYFVRDKKNTRKSVGSGPILTRGCVADACTRTPVDDTVVQSAAHSDLVDISRVPTNSGCRFLQEPRRNVTSDGKTGAKRHWALLRDAVYSGHFLTVFDSHRKNYFEVPTASRRGVKNTARMSSFSPMRFPEEQNFHSIAMTTLLASVANESRWEKSPYFSPSNKFGELQKQQARRGLDVSFSPPHATSPPREARRREAFLERVRVFSARQRLLTLHYRRKRHLVLQQRAVDCFINEQVAQTMRLLLLFLGVIAAMAAALCICGMIHVEGNSLASPQECAMT